MESLMASKVMAITLLLMLCLLPFSASSVQGATVVRRGLLQEAQAPAGTDCPQKCDTRCSKAGRADRCIQYCLICCSKCDCVPAGTYGYPPGDCECYANWMSTKKTHKCP